MKCKQCGDDTWVGVETSLCDRCKPFHEEGQYQNKCVDCGKFFFGHKRQIVCGACKNTSSVNLLTREQQDILAKARKSYQVRFDHFKGHATVADEMCADLFAIIDDLLSRAPKQYTEGELRQEFEKTRVPGMIYLSVDPHGQYHKAYVQAWWENWIACARFLGALKAEP